MGWLFWLIVLPLAYTLLFSKLITKTSWEHYLWMIWIFWLLWGWHRTFYRWMFGDEDHYVRAAHAVGSGGDYQFGQRSAVFPHDDEEEDEEDDEDDEDEEDDDYDDEPD